MYLRYPNGGYIGYLLSTLGLFWMVKLKVHSLGKGFGKLWEQLRRIDGGPSAEQLSGRLVGSCAQLT